MRRLLVALIALTNAGCPATYTSIYKLDNDEYVVTKMQDEFFRVKGTVLHCKQVGQADALRCVEVDSP